MISLLGEITTLLVISVLAGILIGWCIKSLLAGRSERIVRTHVARDVDEAMSDVESLRQKLHRKEDELSEVHQELQKMRGRDMSMKAGNSTQIDEINKLKNELAIARQSLDRNRTEFNTFRNESQREVQTLNNQVARFTAGGPVYDERMSEAGETITALRNASRENDRVIESLRARVKEGDSTVENLRSQLTTQESSVGEIQRAQQSADAAVANLNTSLSEVTAERDQLKRDNNITLTNKNNEITRLQNRLEELGKSQTELKQTEHELEKTRRQVQESTDRSQEQIAELKQSITHKEAERAAYLNDQKRLQQEIEDLQADRTLLKTTSDGELQKAKHELNRLQDELKASKNDQATAQQRVEAVGALKTQVDNKSAEVVALNDMLRNVSDKRNELQTQVSSLESKLAQTSVQQDEQQVANRKIADLTSTLRQRDETITKLRADFDEISHRRNQLGIELGDLQSNAERDKAAIKAESDQQLAQLAGTLKDRDQSFTRLRKDMDDMTVSRDRLTSELQQLQTRGTELENFKSDMQTAVANRDSELELRTQDYHKLQNEFNTLSKLRDDYEVRIEKLKAEVEQQAQQLKNQEQRSREASEKQAKLLQDQEQRSRAEIEQQTLRLKDQEQRSRKEIEQQAKLLQEQEQRSRKEIEQQTKLLKEQEQRSREEIGQQTKRLQEQEQRSREEIDALKPQISDLRSRLSLADNENLKINAELSDAAALRLALTEKESVIQKLHVDLQDAKLTNSGTDQSSETRIDSLTRALRDRDQEIARLNSSMTDNRLASKQSSSEMNLLKQEIDTQARLIKGLEEQSESTLTLHKKIAAQSTEIEELRARLYQGDAGQATDQTNGKELNELRLQLKQKDSAYDTLSKQLADIRNQQARTSAPTGNNDALKSRVAQLQSELDARNKDVQRLKSETQGFAAVSPQREKQPQPNNPRTQQSTPAAKQQTTARANSNVATNTSTAKPRVFVRPDTTVTTTESLTGVSNVVTDKRVTYTRDGYRIKHLDGRDNLSLLPGISEGAEQELNKHGVSEFDQVVLWGRREVLHFAERSGIGAAQAEGYDWPKLAREILQGTYRRDEHLESDSR